MFAKKVLWASAHTFTEEQREELHGNTMGFDEITSLQILRPDLHAKLINCPGDVKELRKLVTELLDVMSYFNAVCLPIGSPLFMAMLVARWRDEGLCDLYFAQSDRVVVEEVGGKKTSIFKHIKFIKVPD